MECNTIREIFQQPSMWLATFKIIKDLQNELLRFIHEHGIDRSTRIVLTGAGTSAYIADTATCLYARSGYGSVRSVSTTDIVSSPESFLRPEDRLFISFSRSGDSPESVAAYRIARKFCPGALHLVITCNPGGCLARSADPARDLVVVLPPETNDRSLAMTSSFSSMLMASLLCRVPGSLGGMLPNLEAAASFASRILEEDVLSSFRRIAVRPVHRAVFLGSGALKGIACECHLKLQELTDGQVMCAYDSFLGLRHGPKAVIDGGTLVVYLLSDESYTCRYELDLIGQVGRENRPALQVVVSTLPSGLGSEIDFEVNARDGGDALLAEDFKYVPYVLTGQLLGYYFSLARGLDPDAPSVRGTISRVVNGVKIYDY